MTVRLRVVGQRQTEGGRRGRQDGGRHPGCCWCPSFKLKLNQGRKAEAKVLEPFSRSRQTGGSQAHTASICRSSSIFNGGGGYFRD